MRRLLNASPLPLLALALVLAPVSARAQDDDDLLEDDEEDEEGDDDVEDDASSEDAASEDDEDDEGEDEDEESSDGDDTTDEDEASSDEGTEEDRAVASSEEKPAAAADDADAESYETIYVIQGKPRLIGASFEITPQFLQSVSDRFVSHTGFALSGLYNLRENIALEFTAGAFAWWDDPQLFFAQPNLDNFVRLGGHDTDTTIELRERERLQPELVKLYRMTWMTSANFQWSPIYGKFSLHDAILGQFGLYLTVGAGFAGLQNPEAPDLPGPFGLDFIGPVQITTSIGGGLKFYFFDWLGIRFEVRDYVQPLALLNTQAQNAASSTFEVRNTILAQVGVSFVIPTPWQEKRAD